MSVKTPIKRQITLNLLAKDESSKAAGSVTIGLDARAREVARQMTPEQFAAHVHASIFESLSANWVHIVND